MIISKLPPLALINGSGNLNIQAIEFISEGYIGYSDDGIITLHIKVFC